MTLSGKYFADVMVFVHRDKRLPKWALDAITSVLIREEGDVTQKEGICNVTKGTMSLGDGGDVTQIRRGNMTRRTMMSDVMQTRRGGHVTRGTMMG